MVVCFGWPYLLVKTGAFAIAGESCASIADDPVVEIDGASEGKKFGNSNILGYSLAMFLGNWVEQRREL